MLILRQIIISQRDHVSERASYKCMEQIYYRSGTMRHHEKELVTLLSYTLKTKTSLEVSEFLIV